MPTTQAALQQLAAARKLALRIVKTNATVVVNTVNADPTLRRLKRRLEEFVQKVEAFKTAHAAYVCVAPEADVTAAETEYQQVLDEADDARDMAEEKIETLEAVDDPPPTTQQARQVCIQRATTLVENAKGKLRIIRLNLWSSSHAVDSRS